MSNNNGGRIKDLAEMKIKFGFSILGIITGFVFAFFYLEYLTTYLWQLSLMEKIIPYFIYLVIIEIVPFIIAFYFLKQWRNSFAIGFMVGSMIIIFLFWFYYADFINFIHSNFL